MSEATEHLALWREAGVIDAATVERIEHFERERDSRIRGVGQASERPTVTEAFLYLGLVVASIGVFALAADQWQEFESWARVAILGVPAVLSLVAGMGMRAYGETAVERGGQLAWFLGLALFGGVVLVIGEEYGPGADEPEPRLLAGTLVLVLAAGLWAAWPTHLQVLGLGGAVAFFSQMLGSWPDEFNRYLAGGAMAAAGAALVALSEAGQVGPRLSARPMFATLVVVGAFEMQIWSPWYWEPWTIATGAALVALSMWRESFLYMTIGMLGIFAGLTAMVSEHLSDTLGPQLVFILVGVLIVAGTVVVAQVRRARRWGFA